MTHDEKLWGSKVVFRDILNIQPFFTLGIISFDNRLVRTEMLPMNACCEEGYVDMFLCVCVKTSLNF